jgi:TRAP-type C4-dicarboxylate transport system substrate-binding protein
MRKLLGTLAAALVAISAGAADAAEKWDMASGFPDGNFHTKNIREFIAKIKGGAKDLDINLHSGQSLFKLQDSKRAVQSELVPMAELLLVQFGNEDPIYELSAIPFLADTIDKARKLWSVSREPLKARLAKDGIRLLYGVAWPVQGFYSKTPITAFGDFKGAKMRTYSPMTSRMAEAMGAVPTNVVASEIPQAFSTGLVSSMYTSPATGVDTQAWDYTKHFMDVGGNFTMNVVIVNERAFRRLDAATQKVVLDAATEAETRGWKLSADVTAEHLKIMADKGMTISAPDAKLRAELQRVGDTLTAEWLKKAGATGEQIISAYRKQ